MPGRPQKTPLSPEQIEDRRQVEHMVWLFVVFLLPYIDRLILIIIGAIGIAYALFVSPRLVQVTTRPEELRRVSRAKLSYALASLSALLLFFDRPYIGAGAFAILAVGDALSNLVGRKLGGPRFPYNHRKTLAGSVALWLSGGLAAWVVMWWNRPHSGFDPAVWLGFCLIVAFLCAVVESLPPVIDDNVTIVWAGATAFYILFSLPDLKPELAVGPDFSMLVNLLAAAVAVALGWLTPAGAALAFALGVVSLVSLGWPGYITGLAFVIISSFCTRLGRTKKQQLGLAEPAGGRGSANVAGKGAVPLILAVAYSMGRLEYLGVAYTAAYATAAFDTVATEVGQWLCPTARHPLTLKALRAGTPGGISWQGTTAGTIAALLVGLIPFLFGWLPAASVPVAGVAAFFGSWIESVTKAGTPEKNEPDGSVFNLYTTMAGACLGAGMWLLIEQ